MIQIKVAPRRANVIKSRKSSNERASEREGESRREEGDRLVDVDVDEIQNWFADQARKM